VVQEQHKRQESDDRRDLPTRIRQFKRAMSATQVADLLDFTVSHILKQAKRGKIPSYRIGGAVKFDPIRVADWLEAHAM
jgi:excisionase family DNA binding protein